MINFLNLKEYKRGLKPVTTSEYFSKPNEYHPDGLFSEMIFGPEESTDRKKTFSYVGLNAQVIHPSAYLLLLRLDKKVETYLNAEKQFIVTKGELIEDEENGESGLKSFKKIFPKIKFRGGTDTREKFIKKLDEAYEKNILFIDTIPIIPPTQRNMYQDESQMWIIDPLNDYYIKIIRRNHQLKSAGGGTLFDLLNFELQLAVNDHDAFIKSKIAKKEGLIRSQMLGKRTDFSGRAVITPGPDLRPDEIGLPFRMAITLFEPFIMHIIFYSNKIDKEKLNKMVKSFTTLELSSDSITSVFKAVRTGDKIPKDLYDFLFRVTEMATFDKVILAKRDPALQPENIRAFKIILVHGTTLQMCTLVVGGFNADFDGDQMGVFVPLSKESQLEARQKMMGTRAGSKSDAVTFELSKEMGVGLYVLTKDIKRTSPPIAVSEKDLQNATDPYIPVRYRNQSTTMGKAIFNSAFPPNFPFYNKLVTKGIINDMIPKIIEAYGDEQAIKTFSLLKDYAFKFATIIAPSITLDDIEIPQSIIKLKDKLDTATTEEAAVLLKEMQVILEKHLKKTGLYDLIASGSSKGWEQPMQLLVSKGLIADPTGKILPPVKGSYSDGLTNKEYFSAASGARKGIIDRVLNTATTGYMSRKLAYLLQTVELDKTLQDCKTKRTLEVKLTNKSIVRFKGRYVIKNNELMLFEEAGFKPGDIASLRTPIYCTSQKICHTCYGKLLEVHRTPYIGILAAQIIGERGTQLIMRTFHTGGAVSVKKREILSDIINNDPISGLVL